MNREMKRRLQRQGEIGPDGAPVAKSRGAGPGGKPPRGPAGGGPGGPRRTRPTAFLREVRGELRKVAWPTRAEVINYSLVVFVSLVFIILLIFLLDTAFAKSIFFLFDT